MRIYLRGCNRSMSECLLHYEDVRGACIQTRCKAVSKAVWRDPLSDTGFCDPLFEATLDLSGCDSALQLAEEECLGFNENLLAFFQISIQDSSHLCVQKPVDDLSSFCPDRDPLLYDIDICEIKVSKL